MAENAKEGKTSLATAVLDQLENAGVPGVAEARRAITCKRLFYTVVIIAFLTCAIVHTLITLLKAIESKTSTSVTTGYTDDIDLPDITICSQYSDFMNETSLKNRQKTPITNESLLEDAQKQNISDITLYEWVALSMLMPAVSGRKEKHRFTRAKKMMKTRFNLVATMEGIQTRLPGVSLARIYRAAVDRFAIKCDRVFRSCEYQGRSFDCCSTGFMRMVMTLSGPCWATRISRIKELPKNMEDDQNTMQIELSDWASPTPDRFPAKVLLDIAGDEPLIEVRIGTEQWKAGGGNAYTVYHNVRTSFGFTAKKIVDIPIRGSCVTSIEKKLQFFDTYSSEHCSAEKAMLEANERADCKMDFMEIFDPEVFERNASIIALDRPYCPMFNKTENGAKRIPIPMNITARKDVSACPNLCNRFDYSYSIVRDVESVVLKKKDSTPLQFRYTEDRFTIYVEVETLAWYDYISLIGGIWGIWIGSSLVTLLQVSEIPFRLCCWKAD